MALCAWVKSTQTRRKVPKVPRALFGAVKARFLVRAEIRKSFDVSAFPTLKLCVSRIAPHPWWLSSWMILSTGTLRLNEGKATTYDGHHTVRPLPRDSAHSSPLFEPL